MQKLESSRAVQDAFAAGTPLAARLYAESMLVIVRKVNTHKGALKVFTNEGWHEPAEVYALDSIKELNN